MKQSRYLTIKLNEIHIDNSINPNANTNHRKLNNLSHVKYLIMNSLPSLDISEKLHKFYPKIIENQAKSIRVLPNIQELHLTSQFIWELSIYTYYHVPRKNSIKRHPFFEFLLHACCYMLASTRANLFIVHSDFLPYWLYLFAAG